MAASPTGTVTFLFTDIEGSTSLWERDTSAMQAALARHDEILRGTVRGSRRVRLQDGRGRLLRGVPLCSEAVEAALSAQRSLCAEAWDGNPDPGTLAIQRGGR